tara:strand:- start:4397 stop:5758 length:1362 start_codon:yes stop_codon:yes gene_type:complete
MSGKFEKIWSIPHNDILKSVMDGPDNFLRYDTTDQDDENFFYNVIKNADQSFRDEIDDIYFAKDFHYKFAGTNRRYGDVMGKNATDLQIDNLFKIQEKWGIPASLTLNQETHPTEIIIDPEIRKQFVNFIGEFYERGLRICTISNIHLMGTGILQKNFPEMNWKNTVNHIVGNSQQMVDLHVLGYNYIQLDRQLNRNMSNLRRMSKVAKDRGIKTYLLAHEGCMPFCPFKEEHDIVQPWIGSNQGKSYFGTLNKISCDKWRLPDRSDTQMPRIGTSCVWDTNERFDKYNELVDVFKFSGRLLKGLQGVSEQSRAVWSYIDKKDDVIFIGKCFEDVYNNGQGFLSNWNGLGYVTLDPSQEKDYFLGNPGVGERAIEYFKNVEHPYNTDAGRKMAKALPNCKNQCYDCHLCEDAYGYDHFDSLAQINRTEDSGYTKDNLKNISVTNNRIDAVSNA